MNIVRYIVSLLILHLFTGNGLHGQMMRGTVVDSTTNQVVPFASIYSIKTGRGTHTDSEGYFEWNLTTSVDSLIISSVGYKSIQISSTLLATSQVIKIGQAIIQLKEVAVQYSNKRTNKEIGFYNFKSNTSRGMGPGGIVQNEIFLNYFPNSQLAPTFISKLMFDIKGFDIDQRGGSKAIIRVLRVDKQTGLPGEDLLLHKILVNITRISPDIIVNIEKYKIPFPDEGIFIGLEFICHSDFIFKHQSLVGQKTNCPRITTTMVPNYQQEGKSYFWTFHDKKWKWACITDGTFFPSRAWIGKVFKFGAVLTSAE